MRQSYRRSTNSPIVFGGDEKQRFSDYLEEPFEVVEEANETPESGRRINAISRRNDLNAPAVDGNNRRSRFYKASSNTDDDKKVPLEKEIDNKI